MAEVNINQAMELAMAALRKGHAVAARGICQDVLRAAPGYPPALHVLAVMLMEEGDHATAEQFFIRAIAGGPLNAEFRNNLGALYWKQRRLGESERQFRDAIRLDPRYAAAYANLAGVVGEVGNLSESIELNQRALAMNPSGPVMNNLASAMMRSGRIAEAVALYRQAQTAGPDDPITWSNLLFVSNYDVTQSAKGLFDEHVRWGRRLSELVPPMTKHANGRDPAKRLRIGYFSADFRLHSVAYFLTAILQRHDRRQVEVFCYSTSAPEDAMTRKVQSLADHWRPVLGLPDERIVEIIRADGIDILIDLATHTSNNRMPVFARKPAPILVNYLGYPNTSGLGTMDYRLTDSHADPVGQSEELNVETLVRVDPCAWCFEPLPQAPVVAPPPCTRGQPVTFGSFNALAKVNAGVIETWARILKEAAGSRLLIKAGAFADAPTKERMRAAFGKLGIAGERLFLMGHYREPADHLAAYARVDVALDTFPYHGTTTTCEALWMGVPVVALAGTTHAGRAGVSLLTNVGLMDYIARNIDEYVGIAVKVASNKIKLKKIRSGMRKRLAESPLTDGMAMARRLEGAYREMWRRWCDGTAPKSEASVSHLGSGGDIGSTDGN